MQGWGYAEVGRFLLGDLGGLNTAKERVAGEQLGGRAGASTHAPTLRRAVLWKQGEAMQEWGNRSGGAMQGWGNAGVGQSRRRAKRFGRVE